MATITGTGGADDLFGTSLGDTIDGSGGDDFIQAVGGNDLIYGGSGDDALWAGTGNDTMIGETGDDTYVVDSGGDSVSELADLPDETLQGLDRVLSYITMTDLTWNMTDDAANVEYIRLVSDATWDDIDDGLFTGVFKFATGLNAIGNALDNELEGNRNINTLTGRAGDDTYIVRTLPTDAKADVVVEIAGEGNDTISYTPLVAKQTYLLPDASLANNQVENLTFGGALAINGVGNDLNNILTGNSAANTFDGGLGDDIYVLTSTDKIMVYTGVALTPFAVGLEAGGVDTVEANFTYTIALRPDLENITLTGTGNFNALGNTSASGNLLIGNNSANTLDGGALGGGIDTFFGAGGSDIYIINNSSDIVEASRTLRDDTLATLDGGRDTIKTSVDYDCLFVNGGGVTLASDVEDLILTGTVAVYGRGNTFNNVITGNAIANTLDSGGGTDTLNGGLGADTMIGSGNDVFIVDNSLDTIDESSGEGTAKTTVSYDMSLRAINVETLLLLGGTAINGSGNSLSNTITGNTGVNVMHGWDGDDVINSGGGADNIFGDNGNDTITGGAPNDTMHGGADADTLTGGGGSDTLHGDDGDDSLAGGAFIDTLIGGNGNDIYNMADNKDFIVENGTIASTADLVQAYVSYSIAGFDSLENLSLIAGTIGIGNASNNVISGNGGVNTLSGGAGSDTIFGGAGNDTMDGGTGVDTMTGGPGNDVFFVDDAADVAVAAPDPGPYGIDTVRASVDYDMSVNANKVIALVLTGSAVTGTGNALGNTITGDGLVNTLIGLAGNDAYIMDNTSDTIVEAGGGGQDVIYASVSFDFTAVPYAGVELEDITLTGTNAINATGNALNNTLTGNVAQNVLTGGDGNDTYVIGLLQDPLKFPWDVITTDTSGNDTVVVEGTYSIASRLDLDNITLVGGLNYGAIGNANVNILTGNNTGNNILDAGLSGGAGDTYNGSSGNDTYMADEANDVVSTVLDVGTDLVMASVTYDMSTKATIVENLTLTGSANIDGTGNALANLIIGNSGNNSLSGLDGADTINGGLGADTMNGGTSSDTFFVDNAADFIVEVALEGTADIINSSVSYDMSANALEVEKLTLTGTAISGTGNAIDNIITGNALANTLDGGLGKDTIDGGAGADTMFGGDGDDTFMVDSFADYISENGGEGTADLIKVTLTAAGQTYTLNAAGRQEVENLTLLGVLAVNGTGNGLANTLTGNGAVNILDGGSGADTMNGGGNNDTYLVENVADVVIGTGHVFAGCDYDMGANATGVVFLTLTGASGDTGVGNANGNTITGTGAVDYTFDGGSGNDVFILHRIGDQITDVADGTLSVDTALVDTMLGSSYDMSALAANIDALTVTGAGGFDVYDNGEDNTITGNSGLNNFYGSGGYDTYFVGANDFIIDSGPEGTDIVLKKADMIAVGFSANLTADALLVTPHWQGIEGIKLTGTTALNATGDANSNYLIGNTANNILDGKAGDDLLIGGAGNDTYWVDSSNLLVTGDVVDEVSLGGGGTDIVMAFHVSYALSLNVDNLTLIGPGLDLEGYGNLSPNIIIGTSGNNILSGGAGADTMNGGAGNDTYGIDQLSDLILDSGGVDHVFSGLGSYTLITGMENLTLSDYPPFSVITGIGNTVANIITGNNNKNTLDGAAGADTLIGGLDNDTYMVDNKLDRVIETANVNTVTGADGSDLIITKISGALDVNTAIAYGLTLLPGFDVNTKVERLTLGLGGVIGVGNDLDNVITGNASANTLYGGIGNDTLDGGLGRDTYYGGLGADVFVVGVDAITNHDLIKDWGSGDIIQYDAILIGFDPLLNVLDDFVAYRYDALNNNTIAYVDRDGINGNLYNYAIVAIIQGIDLVP
ncbi:MAG: hypothetical protein ACAH83_12720 [Alphaproteobacteria bacterium]